MPNFNRSKIVWIALFLVSPFPPAIAFDEKQLSSNDKNPPPLQLGPYGPDTAGFHLTWATDAEIIPVAGNICYHLNIATHALVNNAEEPLIFSWPDTARSASKAYPLDGADTWVIPTTAQEFRLIAPSEIQLGQNLNYSAQGAAYVPIRSSEPDCEGKDETSPPSLQSTISREILRDNETTTVSISFESKPLVKENLVAHELTSDNLDGTIIGLAIIPVFLARIDNETRSSAIETLNGELEDYGAEYEQTKLSEKVNSSDLTYIPERLRDVEYGFINLGEASEVTFSLPLVAAASSIEERWFGVVAIDDEGSVLTNGLASAWVPKAQ